MPEVPQTVTSFGSRVVDCGVYTRIFAFGDFEASGNIQASKIRSFGDNIVRGHCLVKYLFSAGNLRIEDSLDAQTIRSLGNVTIHGQLRATRVRGMGDLSSTGRVCCQQFRLWGSASLEAGLSAEQLSLTGTCKIGGLVTGDQIRIRSRGRCEFDEIGASVIAIRAGWDEDGCNGSAGLLNWKCRGTTQVRIIEADIISLENTTAEVVRGQAITVGKGCRIGTVEYSERLVQHPSAIIEHVHRVASPGSGKASQAEHHE